MSLYQMLQESGALGGKYRGGTEATDAFPALSLLECVTAFPAVLAEAAIENEVELTTENMLLAEAAMNESSAFEALNESVFSNMKERVVKYYNKAAEWIKSIIAKIKQWGNTVRMNGKKLSETYGDKVSKVDLKGFTFTGYKFSDDLGKQVKGGVKLDDINKMINGSLVKASMELLRDVSKKISYNDARRDGWKTSDTNEATRKHYEAAIDTLKKAVSAKDAFRASMFSELLGTSVTNADKIAEVLFKHFRNGKLEKVELKEGSGFSRSAIIDRMKREDEIDDILKDYEELQDAIEDAKKELVDSIESVENVEIPDDAPSEDSEKARNYVGARVEVIRSVNSLYQTAIGCITTVRGALTAALRERNSQDKKLFVSMLNYKNPTAKNNSYEDEDILDDGDFDL